MRRWRKICNRPPDVAGIARAPRDNNVRTKSSRSSRGKGANSTVRERTVRAETRSRSSRGDRAKTIVREKTTRAETRCRSSGGEGAKTTMRERTARAETLQHQHLVYYSTFGNHKHTIASTLTCFRPSLLPSNIS